MPKNITGVVYLISMITKCR